MSDTPQRPTVAELAGYELGERTLSYDERDAILYALAVGAEADRLPLVYESALRTLPTYAVALGLWAVEEAGRIGAYDPGRSLHVSQRVAISGQLPRRGSLAMRARIADVWDKGSAALVEIEVEAAELQARYGIFLPGEGGFGGERGPSGRAPEPELPPSFERTYATSPEQAVLYRLTGDRHPLHVDPEAARKLGFERPILHGLCTVGIGVMQLADGLGADPTRLEELEVRLAGPVFPGEELRVRGWEDEQGCRFDALADGRQVLTAGRVRFGDTPNEEE